MLEAYFVKKTMRAKTLLELATLSTSLYRIAKDEKLMEQLSEMGAKGKEKLEGLLNLNLGHEEQGLTEKLMQKAAEAKEEFEKKMSELVSKLYDKMNIAHAEKVKLLQEEIELLKRDIAFAEKRISNLELVKQ
jgi:polyhydroxyalkanoate synthesis regulator phasin